MQTLKRGSGGAGRSGVRGGGGGEGVKFYINLVSSEKYINFEIIYPKGGAFAPLASFHPPPCIQACTV